MAWAYAADSAQTTHAGYRRSHVVCEAWLPLHTDAKLYIYILFYLFLLEPIGYNYIGLGHIFIYKFIYIYT